MCVCVCSFCFCIVQTPSKSKWHKLLNLLLTEHLKSKLESKLVILEVNLYLNLSYKLFGSQDSLVVRAPDSWWKGSEFESGQERQENFLLQSSLCVLTLVWCPFHPRVTSVVRKRHRSFRQKSRCQNTPKHAYPLDAAKSERADYAAVQVWCGNLSGNELTRNSSGNIWSLSSQLVEPQWTDPGTKSGRSVCTS